MTLPVARIVETEPGWVKTIPQPTPTGRQSCVEAETASTGDPPRRGEAVFFDDSPAVPGPR